MHDLTRGNLPDAREAFGRAVHLVIAKMKRHLPPGFLLFDRVICVGLVQECPLLSIEFEEAILQVVS